MTDPDARERHRLLRDAIALAMTSAGWELDRFSEDALGDWELGLFWQPIDDEFSVMVVFSHLSIPPREDRPFEVIGEIGVSYEPARRLFDLLEEGQIWAPRLDVHQLAGEDPTVEEVSTMDGIGPAASCLTGAVLTHAVAWAARYASVDAVVAACRTDSDQADHARWAVPVLLGVSGRYDEARTALAEYRTATEPADRRYRRFTHRLTRWLESDHPLPSLQQRPASESDSEADQRPPRETKEAEEARKQAMREVVDALRPLVAARTRAELYALLRDELSRRDVQVDDPLLLETALDLVQADSKAQRRRISWRILGDTVGSIVRVLRTPEPPPLPEWLEPPDNACRAVPTIPFRWSAISLDPDADQLLRRVVEAVPSPLADGVHLDAWLRGDTGTSGDPDVTTVHLGAEAIGTIEPADLDLYRGALNDAAKDDEHPLLPARITPLRHGGWLVCLQVPE